MDFAGDHRSFHSMNVDFSTYLRMQFYTASRTQLRTLDVFCFQPRLDSIRLADARTLQTVTTTEVEDDGAGKRFVVGFESGQLVLQCRDYTVWQRQRDLQSARDDGAAQGGRAAPRQPRATGVRRDDPQPVAVQLQALVGHHFKFFIHGHHRYGVQFMDFRIGDDGFGPNKLLLWENPEVVEMSVSTEAGGAQVARVLHNDGKTTIEFENGSFIRVTSPRTLLSDWI